MSDTGANQHFFLPYNYEIGQTDVVKVIVGIVNMSLTVEGLTFPVQIYDLEHLDDPIVKHCTSAQIDQYFKDLHTATAEEFFSRSNRACVLVAGRPVFNTLFNIHTVGRLALAKAATNYHSCHAKLLLEVLDEGVAGEEMDIIYGHLLTLQNVVLEF